MKLKHVLIVVVCSVAIFLLTAFAIGNKLKADKVEECVANSQATTVETCEELVSADSSFYYFRGFAFSLVLTISAIIVIAALYSFGHMRMIGYDERIDL